MKKLILFLGFSLNVFAQTPPPPQHCPTCPTDPQPVPIDDAILIFLVVGFLYGVYVLWKDTKGFKRLY